MTAAVDLHLHSDFSDGRLPPAELVALVARCAVHTFALTDHDTVAGLPEAAVAAHQRGLRLIPGVELSVTWAGHELHLLALGIDPDHPALRDGLARQAAIRRERARRIADRLARAGIPGALEGARDRARAGHITRSHFARHLVESGHVADFGAAFHRYLGRGRPGHTRSRWVSLEEAIAWTRAAGGVAVLAHPHRYRLSGRWTRRLLEAFRAAGGEGLEVACGGGSAGAFAGNADHARRHDLEGSAGSDFHDPANPWIRPGRLTPLPPDITPVWHRWPGAAS